MKPSVILISSSDDDDEGNSDEEEEEEEEDIGSEDDSDYSESDDPEFEDEEGNDVEDSDEEECVNDCDDNGVRLHQGSNNDLLELSLTECKDYLRKHQLRLSGTKEECVQRIKEHRRLKDGRGESLYPRSSFSINCTGDACKGDVVLFRQKVHKKQGQIWGKRTVAGRIVKESYGTSKQQHTFTVEVLWSKAYKNLPPLSTLLVKGRNLYRFGTYRQPWKNEAERSKVLGEKHTRGDAARHKRRLRQTKTAFNSDQVFQVESVKSYPTEGHLKVNSGLKSINTSLPRDRVRLTLRLKRENLKLQHDRPFTRHHHRHPSLMTEHRYRLLSFRVMVFTTMENQELIMFFLNHMVTIIITMNMFLGIGLVDYCKGIISSLVWVSGIWKFRYNCLLQYIVVIK